MMKTEINDVIDEKNFIKTKLLLYRNLLKFPYVSKLTKNEGKEICLILGVARRSRASLFQRSRDSRQEDRDDRDQSRPDDFLPVVFCSFQTICLDMVSYVSYR